MCSLLGSSVRGTAVPPLQLSPRLLLLLDGILVGLQKLEQTRLVDGGALDGRLGERLGELVALGGRLALGEGELDLLAVGTDGHAGVLNLHLLGQLVKHGVERLRGVLILLICTVVLVVVGLVEAEVINNVGLVDDVLDDIFVNINVGQPRVLLALEDSVVDVDERVDDDIEGVIDGVVGEVAEEPADSDEAVFEQDGAVEHLGEDIEGVTEEEVREKGLEGEVDRLGRQVAQRDGRGDEADARPLYLELGQ
mmetsp:Transcript_21894/g.53659  ORF Transcript_21894/g.53659 Transcript_21894/m.53659 type:complete len:252 (-) Transcript_21894:340-1095(-)